MSFYVFFFLQLDFIASSTFDPVTLLGERRGEGGDVKALSVAGALAGTELRSMAASYSITWPQHYVHKWISEWSAQQCR